MGGWAPANELAYLKSRGTFEADLILIVLNTEDLVQPFSPFDPKLSGPTSAPVSAVSEFFGRYLLPRVFPGMKVHDPGSSLLASDYATNEETKVLATIDQIRSLAVEHGARFGIVFSPSTDHLIDSNKRAWQGVVEIFRNWAASKNITLIDLTPEYAQHPAADVYLDGVHLRPLGHQLVAKAIEDSIGPSLLTRDNPQPLTVSGG
jgi:lysophospholipase L1-like esterase